MAAAELLGLKDAEFDSSISKMSLKELLDTISIIQKEMAKEQANFNSLNAQLTQLNKNSRQYKQISKEMASSQGTLTALMNRSMKCFQQQGNKHVGPTSTSDSDQVKGQTTNPVPDNKDQPPGSEVNKSSNVCNSNGEIGVKSSQKLWVGPPPASVKVASKIVVNGQPANNMATKSMSNGIQSEEKATAKPNNSASSSIATSSSLSVSSNANKVGSIDAGKNTVVTSHVKPTMTSQINSTVTSQVNSTVTPQVLNVSVTKMTHSKPSAYIQPQIPIVKQTTVMAPNTQVKKSVQEAPILDPREQILSEIRNLKPRAKEIKIAPKVPVAVKVDITNDHSFQEKEIETNSRVNHNPDIAETSPIVNTANSVAEVTLKNDTLVPEDEVETEVETMETESKQSKMQINLQVNQSQQLPKKEADARYEGVLSPREEGQGESLEGPEEIAPHRINLRDWNPAKLLKELYGVKLNPNTSADISHNFIGMEGLMEKLPMNKKKATLLKTWKRRFFKAADGWLHYYETSDRSRPSDSLQLMGGSVEDLGSRILGVDDGRGKYLMVRCPSDKEFGQWKLALESQTADNTKATYVKPVLSSPPHDKRKVVIIDLGSCSLRAGLLRQQATLPEMFFPCVVNVARSGGKVTVGFDAFSPEVRQSGDLQNPVRPSSKMDKANIDIKLMPAIFDKIWTDLKINPAEYWVMLSTPQNLADPIKGQLFHILVDQFKVKGICMVMQALLALYSYSATSGIIVDIGHRMEILPIYDGFIIEGGVSRQSYGGQKVADSLNSALTANKYVFVTPVEQVIVRYIMEQSCYVTDQYQEKTKECDKNPEKFRRTVDMKTFDLPEGAHVSISHDHSCFKSPEGFFNMDLWGMDFPCVHKLVFEAIKSCPIDSRKHMYRSIYLSGGVTTLPGFAERLQSSVAKLAPPTVLVEVHSAPQRYHAAYIGACALASMDSFEQTCISMEEWKKHGAKAFMKWNMK